MQYRLTSRLIIVAGFNVKSTVFEIEIWSFTRLNKRGEMLKIWAFSNGLQIINRDAVSTCDRWQRKFIMNLTWCSPPLLSQIRDWRIPLWSLIHSFFHCVSLGNWTSHIWRRRRVASSQVVLKKKTRTCFEQLLSAGHAKFLREREWDDLSDL